MTAPWIGFGPDSARWVCEFCYKPAEGTLPDDWVLVFQSAVCPQCHVQVKENGGYHTVKGGAYSYGPDPRGTVTGPWTSVTELPFWVSEAMRGWDQFVEVTEVESWAGLHRVTFRETDFAKEE